MRLLNTETLQLQSFPGEAPHYAILSHTWGEEEVTFQDIQNLDNARKLKGFAKVQGCCTLALAQKYEWAWIDTCCIDKTSSAELSETINSMYRFYQMSNVCYVYLEDVDHLPEEELFRLQELYKAPTSSRESDTDPRMQSRWFSRGWTLQELIAPPYIEFYAKDWTSLGTKSSLESFLVTRTGIPQAVFRGKPLSAYCVAERMSWTKGRKTTREEDLAYSLLGIFNITMPLLYGEGKWAFLRLQEEIFRRTEDTSIFMWSLGPCNIWFGEEEKKHVTGDFKGGMGAFAPHPACFDFSKEVAIGDVADNSWESSRLHAPLTRAPLANNYDPPQVTTRGMILTMLIADYGTDHFLAWTYTFANVDSRPNNSDDDALKSERAMICIVLQKEPVPLFARIDPMTKNSLPILLKRSGSSMLHFCYDEQFPNFQPRKICLSLYPSEEDIDFAHTMLAVARREQSLQWINFEFHDKKGQHLAVLEALEGARSSSSSFNGVPGWTVSFPRHGEEPASTKSSRDQWAEVTALGITKIQLECRLGQHLPEESMSVYIGWALTGGMKTFYFNLAPPGVAGWTTEDSLLLENYTDKQYMRLSCGHLVRVKMRAESVSFQPQNPIAEVEVL